MNRFLIILIVLLSWNFSFANEDYPDLDEIKRSLDRLASEYPDYFSYEKIAESPGGNSVFLAKAGQGDEDLTPGLLFLSGVDGKHPAGTVMVLSLAEKILSDGGEMLDRFYFYFVPVLSPDAYAQYHDELQYERSGNARETDIDRDGRISEDPYEDLNGDGMITQIRIEDASGEWVTHEKDPRVLVPLKDRTKAQTIYRIISEGIDNDKDGLFNEDGPGGINLNMNFSFDYPAFQPGAGEHAVSEPENRGLAEFLFERWNIYAVFTFALENNLSHPIGFDRQKVSRRIITGPLERDATSAQMVATKFSDNWSIDDAPEMKQGPGSFSSWAYFHYCRFSFVSPAWWAPVVVSESEEEEDAEGESEDSSAVSEKELKDNYDLRYIQWAKSEGVEDFFVDWEEIDHPDFPGRKAEVGGFKPFVRNNPPLNYLEEPAENYFSFIQDFTNAMPTLEFQDVEVEKLERNVFRVTGRVVNTSLLPTSTQLGDRTRWVRDTRCRILLNDDQELLLGHYRSFHKSLDAGEYFEFSWLVSGSGKVVLDAGSPMTGLVELSLELK